MKTVRILFVLITMLSMAFTVNAQKKGEKTVVFNANLHCESCKNKIEKNIPYEKGVKDLKVDMKANTITVTFVEAKNSTENLQKAIEKLDIQIKGMAGNTCPNAAKCDKAKDGCEKNCDKKKCDGKECGDKCCQKTGKTEDCCKTKKK